MSEFGPCFVDALLMATDCVNVRRGLSYFFPAKAVGACTPVCVFQALCPGDVGTFLAVLVCGHFWYVLTRLELSQQPSTCFMFPCVSFLVARLFLWRPACFVMPYLVVTPLCYTLRGTSACDVVKT